MLAEDPAVMLSVGAAVADDAAGVVICTSGPRVAWKSVDGPVKLWKFASPLYTGVT